MIFVSPLSAVEQAIAEHGPTHLISLLDPETMIETPAGIEPARHLQVGVNDISEPADFLVAPGHGHIEDILSFIEGWDPADPMLIHCWAGISRSTATAFITLCALNDEADEAGLARLIRDRADHAQPNRLMVRLADEVMGRNGRMIEAVETLPPGRVTWEGTLFSLPLRPDL